MLVSLTVGKVDAGVAVLLTDDKRLIEFPSILLPPDISSGSIVDITVARNFKTEAEAAAKFAELQNEIYRTFGLETPKPPCLRCRNATQTSVVLEWDPIELATAELRSLSLYRNGAKAGSIPRPLAMQCTKISGLAVDTEYTFHLVLRTSAGTHASERLTVRTHKMTDLSGITVTTGVMPAQLKESLATTIRRIGAKLADSVRIDTTHFVCTEGRGQAWEKAVEMNIPIVVPDWVKGCEREGRIVGVRGYYLNADPRLRQVGQSNLERQAGQRQQPAQQQQQAEQAVNSPRTEITPPTPDRATADRSGGGGVGGVGGGSEQSPRGSTTTTETAGDEDTGDEEPGASAGDKSTVERPEPKSRTVVEADEPKALKDEVKPSTDGGADEDTEEDEDEDDTPEEPAKSSLAPRNRAVDKELPPVKDDGEEKEFDDVAL